MNLFDTLRSLLDTLILGSLTRLELFSVEVREEVSRVIQLLILTAVAIFFSAIGLVIGTFTVIFAVWNNDTARLAALIIFSFLYLGGAVWAGLTARVMLKSGDIPFGETLNQLRKDREWLKHRN